MTQQSNSLEKKEKNTSKKARGLFPRLPLSKTLELVIAIYELGHGEEVRRRSVFDKLGKSPDSGSSRILTIAANSGYNLINGSYKSNYHSLTENGLLYSSGKEERIKIAAIYNSLFDNQIFSALIGRFQEKPLPIDEIAIDYLRKNHGLPEGDAKDCWEVFKTNIRDYGLVEKLSDKDVLISYDTAIKNIGGELHEQPSESSDGDSTSEQIPARSEKAKGSMDGFPLSLGDVVPQVTFNIQIVIPENASPGTYEDIFRSIATHLLKRGIN